VTVNTRLGCYAHPGFTWSPTLFIFETRSHYVAQAGLKFTIFLPLPPEWPPSLYPSIFGHTVIRQVYSSFVSDLPLLPSSFRSASWTGLVGVVLALASRGRPRPVGWRSGGRRQWSILSEVGNTHSLTGLIS
jgi:hypothetical protein